MITYRLLAKLITCGKSKTSFSTMAQPKVSNLDFPAHINGMFPGRTIIINGIVDPGAERFSVNLLTALDLDTANNAFHFNPRFDEGLVVLNSREDGNWGEEEREERNFPFQEGEPFEMSIKCRKEFYEVRVNKEYFCKFEHNIPLYEVAYLAKTGDVTIQSVYFQEGNRAHDQSVSFKNPVVGETYDIPFPSINGNSVQVIGEATDEASFAINFMLENGDIALHINPRFGEEAIVRNSLLYGAWGNEERDLPGEFPFSEDSPFLINVDVDEIGYEVKLNGVHQFDFVHRTRPIKKINSVQITGDGVEIHEISFH